MVEKLKRAALKTGLDKEKIGPFFSFSIVALIMSFFSSCAKNSASTSTLSLPKTVKPVEVPVSPADVIIDTSTFLDEESCGPTPNYPCGTRYYTVSVNDFKA